MKQINLKQFGYDLKIPSMHDGKSFERFIAEYLKKRGVYFLRLYDSRSVGGLAHSQPADFLVWHKNKLIYIECKTTQRDCISLNDYQPRQLKEAMQASERGILYLTIVNFNGIIMFEDLEKLIELCKCHDCKTLHKAIFIPFFELNDYL
jgi:Holliday junction resolvase